MLEKGFTFRAKGIILGGMEKLTKTPQTLDEAIKIIEQLSLVITELKNEIVELKERLNTNSKNSSTPPSQDRFKKKQKKNLVGVSLAGSQAIRELQEDYYPRQK